MPETIGVDPEALRADVRDKYREVALHPDGEFHFHTGRGLAPSSIWCSVWSMNPSPPSATRVSASLSGAKV